MSNENQAFVLFTCPMCQAKDQKVYVPLRQVNEDIKSWLDNKVIPRVAYVHQAFGCSHRKCDLKIPFNKQDLPLGVKEQYDNKEKEQ